MGVLGIPGLRQGAGRYGRREAIDLGHEQAFQAGLHAAWACGRVGASAEKSEEEKSGTRKRCLDAHGC